MRLVIACFCLAIWLGIPQTSIGIESAGESSLLAHADSLYERHAFREMERLAEEELPKARAAHGDSSIAVAEWLLRRSRARGGLDDLEGSRSDLEESVAILRLRKGSLDPALHRPLCALGSMALIEGRHAEAESLYAAALSIVMASMPSDSLSLASTLIEKAEVLLAKGRYREGVAQVELGIGIGRRQEGVRRQDVAYWWDRLAIALSRMGDYVRAEEAERQAIAGFEAVFGTTDPYTGVAYNNMAFILENLGDAPQTLRYLERALSIHEQAKGRRTVSCGRILYNLALASNGMGDSRAAQSYAGEALSILSDLAGASSLEARRPMVLLGQIASALGDSATAERYLRDAFAISDDKLGPDHPFTCLDASALAMFFASEGRFEEARDLLETYATTLEERYGPTHRHVIALTTNLAIVLLRSGRTVESWDRARRTCLGASDAFGDVFGAVSERRALLYADRLARPLDVMLSATLADPRRTPARVESTFVMVGRSRGRILDYLADRGRAAMLASGDSLARAVVAAREDLADLILRGPGKARLPEYEERVDRARWRKEEAEGALARTESPYSQWLPKSQGRGSADLDRIMAALPQQAAVVEYVRFRDWTRPRPRDGTSSPERRDAAFVLRRGKNGDAEVQFLPLGRSDRTDSLVRVYRREVASGQSEFAMKIASRSLHDAIWAPVAPLIASANLVLLLPDGPLHFVDFATLVDPDDRFLIESTRFHRLTSLRDLIRLGVGGVAERQGERKRRLLAVGDPMFDRRAEGGLLAAMAGATGSSRPATSGCDPTTLRAQPLPGTATELARIRDLFAGRDSWKQDELAGDRAGEGILRRTAPGSSIVHLATHGFFLDVCRMDEPTAVAQGPEMPDFVRREQPMLLSGILLAGCNHLREGDLPPPSDDGWLTAEELSILDLRGTDWVVMSACDTGLGETSRHEGVLGLQRAIELAGARTSILSLWKVADSVLPNLMSDLYRRRIEGSSTVDALREAQLAALERARGDLLTDHPRVWAGLVATGDWR